MNIEVLIPSYNRASFVYLQIASLRIIRDRLAHDGIDLRIIVSDNHSNPAVVIPLGTENFVSVVKPSEHLPTAEENVVFGLRSCRAEYVWLLGDDDAPIIDNAVTILKDVATNKPDYVVTNCSGSLVDGDLLASRTFCTDPSKIDSTPSFVTRTGFTFVMAGFSCIVCRRDMLEKNLASFDKYFRVSKIYSLVFWLLETYWDAKFRYFNEPLVIYKQNESDMGGHSHWPRVAAKEQVFQRYFWTLGFARLAKVLKQAKHIPQGFFGRVIEQNWTDRFPALGHTFMIYLDQLDADLKAKGGETCRTATTEETAEFLEFMMSEDPRYLEAYAPLTTGGPIDSARVLKARHALHKYLRDFFSGFFIKPIAGWNLYFFDGCYRALPSEFVYELVGELRDISPLTSTYQLVGSTQAEVEALIYANPFIKSRPKNTSIRGQLLRTEIEVLQKWARLLNKLKRMFPSWIKARLGGMPV